MLGEIGINDLVWKTNTLILYDKKWRKAQFGIFGTKFNSSLWFAATLYFAR